MLPELYAELIRFEDQDCSPERASDLLGAVSDQVGHLRDHMAALGGSGG